MKTSYKFSNVLGSTYHSGTLTFTPNGFSLLSPVGNKILKYDLKNNKSEAIPAEVNYNITHLAISPTGTLLIIATEKNEVYICSLLCGTLLHQRKFHKLGGSIKTIKFSPNGRHYCICGGSRVLIYLTPGVAASGVGRELSPFKICNVFKVDYDEVTCCSWSDDSKLIAVGSNDLTVKVFAVGKDSLQGRQLINLCGHNDRVSLCTFAGGQTLDIYSASRNGQLFIWEASYSSDIELNVNKLIYRRSQKFYFKEQIKSKNSNIRLMASDYNKSRQLLVTGFSNGAFLLHEMPQFNIIHSLELSTNGSINSIVFNNTGDWIAIGSSVGAGSKYDLVSDSSSQSQLIVFEWQSQSFILKQSGTGSGVTNVSQCICYSPDGSILASGATDGKIRLWNTFTGFCFATFSQEHKGPITCIKFVANKGGKVIISSSLDGTVRAFDLNRYRNFRTFSLPNDAKTAQFICCDIDSVSGDFIAAGSQNFFEIFLWSLQTGRLLECLAGHEAPVSGVSFSPSSNLLVSCSWDSTVRIWDLFESSKCTRETIQLGSDCVGLAFRLDGNEFAVATMNGNITFFNPRTAEQHGTAIEGKCDLGISQNEADDVKNNNKYFSTLCYSADGCYIIGGGESKHVCLYQVEEKLLVKKFTITWNLSLDGMFEYISKRNVSEYNLKTKLRDEDSDLAAISLPGVAKGDFSSRSVNAIVAISSIQFSPTMRCFAFSSTEGIIMYSLDKTNNFDPYQLDVGITPQSIKTLLQSGQYNDAIMQSLRLNEKLLIQEVLESVPANEIDLICSTLPLVYVEKCINIIASQLESTQHVEFYVNWCQKLLYKHGIALKSNYSESLTAILRHLQRNLTRHFNDLSKITNHNKYLVKFVNAHQEVISNDSMEVE